MSASNISAAVTGANQTNQTNQTQNSTQSSPLSSKIKSVAKDVFSKVESFAKSAWDLRKNRIVQIVGATVIGVGLFAVGAFLGVKLVKSLIAKKSAASGITQNPTKSDNTTTTHANNTKEKEYTQEDLDRDYALILQQDELDDEYQLNDNFIHNVPNLGFKKSLADLGNGYAPCKTRDSLLRFSKTWDYRPIKGDGHCLFRSLGSALMKNLKESPSSKDYLNALEISIKTLGGKEQARLETLLNNIRSYVTSNNSFERIMTESKSSDTVVEFLRLLSCQWNRAHANGVLESLACTLGLTRDEYLEHMASLKIAMHGDQPEIIALSTMLGTNIQVLDSTNDHESIQHSNNKNAPTFTLLYRAGHYDWAIPK